jgi:hypothetical protein
MSENPFAASELGAGVPEGGGDGEAWVEGDVLVTKPTAVLPLVCAKCGAREGVTHLRLKQQWTPLWVRLTVLLSPLIMLILFLIFKKTFDLQVGLCPAHASRRRLGMAGGTVGVVLGFLAIMGGGMADDLFLLSVGLLLIVVGIVPLALFAVVLKVRLVTDERAEFTGAHPELLRAVAG